MALRREPTKRQVQSWRDSIERTGRKRIRARFLLQAFGLQRRGPVATNKIINWLRGQEPPLYQHGLNYVRSLNEPVFLSNVDEMQIGRLVEREKELMDRFKGEIMPQLDLHNPRRGFRPPGSKDRLDFLCVDKDGRAVVVEMKKENGEKRVVEQVIRYIRLIRNLTEYKDPHGLIITGYADKHTRHVLEELEPDYKIDWHVYGLDDDDRIKMLKVAVQSARQ